MRGQIDSKSDTCTGSLDVDAAGISAKVNASYSERSVGLPSARGGVMSRQKSAEGIVGLVIELKA
jgi:hypothetical protein